MKYLLTIVASDRDRFRVALASFLRKVDPQPTMVHVVDPGKKAKAEKSLAAGEIEFGQATGVVFDSVRRDRLRKPTANDATAAAWRAIGAVSLPFAVYLEDGYEFHRRVDLRDVGHVLHSEPTLAQMAFVVDGDRQGETFLRGSGGVAWRLHGPQATFRLAPSLIPRWVARNFPWPDSADELAYKMRLAIPATGFGSWGVGDPWVRRV